MKTIEISLNTVRVLLWGDSSLESITPKTIVLGDLAKVKILPFELGKALAASDPEEEYFHVEIVPSTKPHAEIWLSFEWAESNARRERFRQFQNESREAYNKRASRLSLIKDKLTAFGFSASESYINHLSSEILNNYKKGDFSKTLSLLNLAETLTAFEEEDKV